MITLGLDMASKKSGYSLFDNKDLVEYGLWEIPNADEIDWRDRVVWMSNQLNNFIQTHKVDKIYIEDVPLRMENPQTLKILSALQGAVISVCTTNNIKAQFIGVSQWRSALGLFNGSRKGTEREELKKSSIDYANKTFGLNLVWKSKSSKFNQDDIADSINVAYSQLIEKKNFGRR
ncbi:MAG: hypothetical protein KBT03_04175 [Bacteroidales bacterium]|nr:hypothetical protein [Candidatus Scybalousia scybalohippi]